MSTVVNCPECRDSGYITGEDWDGCETVTRCDCRPPAEVSDVMFAAVTLGKQTTDALYRSLVTPADWFDDA